jgi:hypothetical protein
VFDNYAEYSGSIVLLALLFYMIQIYADFSGGIDIARGVAQCMGIEMGHNFMRPYFAHDLSEFWRRWHMSLSFWTRDYIFYSIALSKFFGKLGKDLRKILGDRVGKLVPVIIAQYATFITIGIRVPDCTGNCSMAYNKPLALVALITRPPATAAP